MKPSFLSVPWHQINHPIMIFFTSMTLVKCLIIRLIEPNLSFLQPITHLPLPHPLFPTQHLLPYMSLVPLLFLPLLCPFHLAIPKILTFSPLTLRYLHLNLMPRSIQLLPVLMKDPQFHIYESPKLSYLTIVTPKHAICIFIKTIFYIDKVITNYWIQTDYYKVLYIT